MQRGNITALKGKAILPRRCFIYLKYQDAMESSSNMDCKPLCFKGGQTNASLPIKLAFFEGSAI